MEKLGIQVHGAWHQVVQIDDTDCDLTLVTRDQTHQSVSRPILLRATDAATGSLLAVTSTLYEPAAPELLEMAARLGHS